MRNPHPLAPHTTRTTLACCGGLAIVALIAGAVRVLPWLLDPAVPLRVAGPFVRGVLELAVEAAVVVGWPLGWALAGQRFAERGEARVLMLLGESPLRTAAAQWRGAWPFALVLAIASVMGAIDATAPGRMAQDLVEEGRTACANATTPTTYAVPFVSATWLCAPGYSPRLYGTGPGSLHAVLFTAAAAHIAPDMRRIELDDARLSIPQVDLQLGRVVIHGMAPWTHASNLGPVPRAVLLVFASALAAALALSASLMRLARGTLAAVLVGASGPLATLGLMRVLERGETATAFYALTPLAAVVSVAAAVGLGRLVRWTARLR